MKIVVGGSRRFTDAGLVERAIESSPWRGQVSEVVQGGAAGVDELARKWAEAHGVPVVTIHARWNELGRAAGPRRNRQMVREPDVAAVIVVWDGRTAGSRSLLAEARRAGLPTHEVLVNEEPK